MARGCRGGSGIGDDTAFGYLVFWFTRVAGKIGVEREALVREVVAVAVDLELPLRTRVLGDIVAVTRSRISPKAQLLNPLEPSD